MNREGKKCVLYSRVSTEMQVDGFSLEGQITRMKTFAEREEMDIVKRYEDAGKSGKSIAGRPAFQLMLADIQEGKQIDYILVYKLSRFGRNAADILNSLQKVQDYGVNLISVEEGIDSSQASGKLLISVLSAVAEIERENILEQTMNGRKEKARQGLWNGGPAPYGYSLKDDTLIINEQEAEVVRLIYDKFANTDMGYNGVAKYLNLQGIAKNKHKESDITAWSARSVQCVLDNPVYAGKIAYGRRIKEKVKGSRDDYRTVRTSDYLVYDGKHDALVDQKTWEKVREKRSITGFKSPSRVGRERIHLLTGLLKCPKCGSPMYCNRHSWQKKDGTYKDVYYYYCGHNGNPRGYVCNYKAKLRTTDIEPYVVEAIKELIRGESFAKEIKSRIGQKANTEAIDTELRNYKKKLIETETNKANLEETIDNLPLDIKYRERKLKDMSARLDSLYDTINDLEECIEDASLRRAAMEEEVLTLDNVYKLLLSFDKIYDIMSDKEKKDLISYLIKDIQIYSNEEQVEMPLKSITLNFPIYSDSGEVNKLLWENQDGVEEPVVPAKTGYNGKWENYTLGLSDITVNAVYSVITYNITYKNVGGIINNNPSAYTVEDLPFTFQDPEKNGYMFLGWYKNQDFSDNKIFGLPVDFAENVTLYAKWKPVEYGIYYDLCGGTNVSENPNSYTIESSDITLSSPVRSGYTFLGWYKTSDFTGDKVTVIKSGSSENISLFAQWQAIEYTATFKNGDEIVSTVKFTVENFVINEPYLPLRTGYTGRWEHYVLGASDITINSVYTLDEYTITYEDEFNAPNANKNTYTIESETITLVPLEKPGYEFLGWFNGSARIEKIERGSYGHRTLTARWQAAEYDVMYHLNGGTNAESNPEKYTIESADIELAAPSKDYYVFDGWYSDSAFSEKVEKISTGSYGNKEFYAKWKAVEYTASFQADGNIAGRVKFTVETVSITEPAVPEKAGYSGAWESYTLGTEDITINAVYTLITYKIIYKNIDGETNENPAEYNVEKLPLVLSAAKLRGYTFVGWFEKEDLSGESVSEIASGRTGNLTFYAKWEVTEYSIEYELNGGTNNAQNPSAYTINSEKIVLRAPEKDEFDFDGWYSDEAFTNRITEIAAGSVGNVKVYAKWVLPEPVYIITEDGEIIGLTEHGKTLTVLNIPEKVNGITVTRIGDRAFTYCSNITSVTIPETVTSIGKMAFMRCTGLTSIVIPSRVTTVEDSAFSECYGLKKVEIPGSIGKIAYGTFFYCKKLVEVVIPEGITSIGKSAFERCYGLTSIIIPSSVTLIDLNAFLNCNKLIEVINKSSLNIVKGETDNGFVGYYALNVKKSGTSEIKN